MAYPIPTVQDSVEKNQANFESALNQESPPLDISFTNFLSVLEAFIEAGLYKYVADRAKANLALTAGENDLQIIGTEFNVIRKPAEVAEYEVELPAVDGTLISSSFTFVGDSNGVIYNIVSSETATGGKAILQVFSEVTGVVGNLNISDTMTLNGQIPGAETVATITDILNIGVEQEDLETYRQRVLFAERAATGGSNVADHKIWAEEVAGVKKAFPYSGKPFETIQTSYPGDRTVYIEATTAIDPDGIAPQSLLDDVRDSLNEDPVTGASRPALGLEDCNLYVLSIERVPFDVTIINLLIDPENLDEAEQNIEEGLELYFKNIEPFVEGIDVLRDKNDRITNTSISKVVQDAVGSIGGSVESVGFGETGQGQTVLYVLEPGRLAKLNLVDYVTT